MEQADLDGALEMFRSVLSKNSNHTPSYLSLGVIYTRKNHLNLAIEAFESAVRIDKKLLVGQLLLGQAYAAKGLNEKAKGAFERVIAIKPDYPRGYLLLGILYETEGNISKARKHYQTVTSLNGKTAESKQAQKRIELLLKKGKQFFDEGIEALNAGDFKRAEDVFQKSLLMDPDNAFALYNLGRIYEVKKQLDTASDFLKAALNKKPDFLSARLFLGQIYETKGEVGRAILEYKTVRSEAKNQDEGDGKLASQKLRQIGETEEIAKAVQTLLKKGTEHLEKGNIKNARTEFLQAVVFLPEQVYAHYSLGLIALLRGELSLAERRFKRVIQINTTHLLSRIGLGEAYERQGKVVPALEAFQEAARMYPYHERPRLALASLYEKQNRIDEALEAYHQVTDFPGKEDSKGKKLAQGRIDFYEKRFHVDFSSTSLTYDSNSNRTEQHVPEIESSVSLGLIYFLKKKERFRVSLRLALNTKLFHRTQIFFINEGLSLVSLWNLPNYMLVQGLDFDTGRSGGVREPNEKSFSSTTYRAEVIKFRAFPSETNLHFDLQRLKLSNNSIFNSHKRTLRLSLFQNLKLNQNNLGRIGLSYSFLDNDIDANDQRRRAQVFSINYSRPILPSLSGTVGLTKRYIRFRHPDSLSLSRGEIQRRRNEFTNFNVGLNYRPEPGVSLFLGYVKQKNRSNLPTAAAIDPLSLNAGQDGSSGAGQTRSLADGHVASLGDYDRELFIFGASAAMDLKRPYPRWRNFQKQISVALTVGYFEPSLKNLNAIIGDPKHVIIQDPNHLLPSNPTFLSDEKNLKTEPIGGSLSNGIEIEWEMKPRHALVFSISEWQNKTVAHDTVPLLLSPTEDAIPVPRSTRYNLAINQLLLTWRYAFFNDPGVGRFYLNIGLFGGTFSNLTIDSLVKVTNPPIGNAFASMGSIEARSTSFSTHFGFGGAFFIRSWLSLGLDLNYRIAEAAKLEVKREFPADFADLTGVPAVNDNPCRLRDDTSVQGDTLSTIDCAADQVVEGGRAKFLKLRLDGFEARLMLRFHFGEGLSGKTSFERWVGWDQDEEKSIVERLLPSSVRENLRLNGVLKNETAYRFKEPVTFTKSLFLFRLNSRYALSRQISATVRTRSFYDAIYDLVDIDTISPRRFPNTILTQLPQNPSSEEVASIEIENSRSVDINRHGFEFREVFLDINFQNVDFRIGRQIVRWGVVAGARVTDEVNPFDFSEFILRETDDRFIPLMMLRTNYFYGDSRFEFIWIPEVVPHRPAPKGSEFEQFEILPGFKATQSFIDSELSVNLEAFDNSEVAFRMMENFNGLELGMTAFYTWDDFPTSFRSLDGSSGGGFGAAIRAPDFFPEQRRITIFGTMLSKSIGRFVLNAEYAYVFDKFFGTLLTVGTSNPTLGEAQRDYMKYAVGLDVTYWGTDLSLSFLQQYILNWTEIILQDRVDTVASLFLRKAFMNERIVVQSLILYFVNEDDILLRPVVEARISDNVKFRFGADFFVGDRGARVGEFDFIGFFKDSDRFYLEIIRSF